jgi:hypothetical protein
VSAGTSDVIAQARLALDGGRVPTDVANVDAAAAELGAQVKRLVAAGAALLLRYNLGRSPWAHQIGSDSVLEPASTRFNQAMLVSLDDIAVSSGAACTAAEPSHVLVALGLSKDRALASLRFGIGRTTTESDVDYAAGKVSDVVARLQHLHVRRPHVPHAAWPQLFGDYAKDRIRERW